MNHLAVRSDGLPRRVGAVLDESAHGRAGRKGVGESVVEEERRTGKTQSI